MNRLPTRPAAFATLAAALVLGSSAALAQDVRIIEQIVPAPAVQLLPAPTVLAPTGRGSNRGRAAPGRGLAPGAPRPAPPPARAGSGP